MYQIHPTITATLVDQRRHAFEIDAANARLARTNSSTSTGRRGAGRDLRLGFGRVRGVVRRRPALV